MELFLSLLQVVILLPLFALVTTWLYIQWAYRRQLTLARKLPTALPAYPLIGHLKYLETKSRVGGNAWKLALGHRSGISCFWLGPVPYIMIQKAEHMKVVLNNSNSLGKPTAYDVVKWLFGNGLPTAPVQLWKITRKHINPMFHSENLQHYLPTINENARHLVEDLSEHVGKEVFDCEDYMFSTSSINILKLLFGPGLVIQSEKLEEMFKGIKRLLSAVAERTFNPFMRSDKMFKLLKKESFNHIEELRKHLKVLGENNQKLKATVKSTEQNDCVKILQDIFNLLKEKDKIFNEDYLMSELVTFIVTGVDTNAVTMSSCLVAIGSHPNIQKNLYEEIISVAGGNTDINAEDVSKMTYLDQVLKETLRYFTIVPLAGRRCDRDVQLEGYTIPEGTTVMISLLGAHMNEEVFPDPLKFDPDRFSPDNIAKRHSYSFLPFGGGPRNCIGKNYAMMAVKITLVHLLKSYEIKSTVDIRNITYRYNISMVSADGYNISIKKRF